MNVSIETGDNLISVRITGSCTIYEAADFRAALLPLVASMAPVMVDLSGITELDCAGLQILLALQKECALVLFSHPGDSTQQVLDLLNLNRCFAIEA